MGRHSWSAIRGVDTSPCISLLGIPSSCVDSSSWTPWARPAAAARPTWDGSWKSGSRPEAVARAAELDELDERAMRGEGSAGDAMEALSIVWPAYFPNPDQVPAMPVMTLSPACYSEAWGSIHRELGAQSLAKDLGRFRAPTVFVLGAGSPIPPRHGVASAALISGAETDILEACGHFPWLDRPGMVRNALLSVQSRSSGPTMLNDK